MTFPTALKLLGQSYDRANEIDARFSASTTGALTAIDTESTDDRDQLQRQIALFANDSKELLFRTLKGEHYIRDNVHRISRVMYDAYVEVDEAASRARAKKFYEELTIIKDWPAALADYNRKETAIAAKVDKENVVENEPSDANSAFEQRKFRKPSHMG